MSNNGVSNRFAAKTWFDRLGFKRDQLMRPLTERDLRVNPDGSCFDFGIVNKILIRRDPTASILVI